VIVYVDSSVLVRSYLQDEDGHEDAVALLVDPEVTAVTGSLTRIEVSGALVRAARHGRTNGVHEHELLEVLEGDLGADGAITVLRAPQRQVELEALRLVRKHGVRAMDACHLAIATLIVPPLREPGERMAFASRDERQRGVAEELGFDPV
jgi:predicted nucleic acid-binding protein